MSTNPVSAVSIQDSMATWLQWLLPAWFLFVLFSSLLCHGRVSRAVRISDSSHARWMCSPFHFTVPDPSCEQCTRPTDIGDSMDARWPTVDPHWRIRKAAFNDKVLLYGIHVGHEPCTQFSSIIFSAHIAVSRLVQSHEGVLAFKFHSFFYGIFFVLFIVSMYLRVYRQHQLSEQSVPANNPPLLYIAPMFIAAICLFMTITAHWILGVYRLFQAFVNFQGGTHPLTFYSDMSNPTEVVQTGLLMVTLVIDDAMIIYRLWIIWCYNKLVVVFPLCTLVGLAVCGGGVTYQQSRLHPGEDIFMSAAGRWITSNCIFTLCTNLYSTSMIVWRVWCANAAIRKYGGGNLMGILAILVESAALYTAWTVFFFVSYESHSNLQLISSETYSAVAGIAFMLINVRVGMGWALKAHEQPIHVASGVMGSQHHGEPSFAMRPLAVNITRVVQREDDFDAFKKSSDSGSPGLASAPGT